ncbi:eCIS core domain-containing protein [Marinoscillum sp.]|uniref:eCIS core domain-containing protein n=1 Tax=Marinoscillum sp. TaxID=2024838 RepID=UPI003BAB90AD
MPTVNSHTNKEQVSGKHAVSSRLSSNFNSDGTQQMVNNRPEAIAQLKLKKVADTYSSRLSQTVQTKSNHTGLPDNLKAGIESLSGFSMDDVKVHRNSSKPAQLQAAAYAQGTHIHLGPGQEKHLPHEAWHVVQQKQGRVQPTMQLKSSININDSPSLENEATMMGTKALTTPPGAYSGSGTSLPDQGIVQGIFVNEQKSHQISILIYESVLKAISETGDQLLISQFKTQHVSGSPMTISLWITDNWPTNKYNQQREKALKASTQDLDPVHEDDGSHKSQIKEHSLITNATVLSELIKQPGAFEDRQASSGGPRIIVRSILGFLTSPMVANAASNHLPNQWGPKPKAILKWSLIEGVNRMQQLHGPVMIYPDTRIIFQALPSASVQSIAKNFGNMGQQSLGQQWPIVYSLMNSLSSGPSQPLLRPMMTLLVKDLHTKDTHVAYVMALLHAIKVQYIAEIHHQLPAIIDPLTRGNQDTWGKVTGMAGASKLLMTFLPKAEAEYLSHLHDAQLGNSWSGPSVQAKTLWEQMAVAGRNKQVWHGIDGHEDMPDTMNLTAVNALVHQHAFTIAMLYFSALKNSVRHPGSLPKIMVYRREDHSHDTNPGHLVTSRQSPRPSRASLESWSYAGMTKGTGEKWATTLGALLPISQVLLSYIQTDESGQNAILGIGESEFFAAASHTEIHDLGYLDKRLDESHDDMRKTMNIVRIKRFVEMGLESLQDQERSIKQLGSTIQEIKLKFEEYKQLLSQKPQTDLKYTEASKKANTELPVLEKEMEKWIQQLEINRKEFEEIRQQLEQAIGGRFDELARLLKLPSSGNLSQLVKNAYALALSLTNRIADLKKPVFSASSLMASLQQTMKNMPKAPVNNDSDDDWDE